MKKGNKAFLAKLATITIGTGAKPKPACAGCGGPLMLAGLALVAKVKRTKPTTNAEEMAFSA